MGADYLAYALWDAIIDGYFPVLENYGEKIEDLEDEVIFNPSNQSLANVYQNKKGTTGFTSSNLAPSVMP